MSGSQNSGLIHGLTIDVYKPKSGGVVGHKTTPAFTIPEEDVLSAEASDAVGRTAPRGRVIIRNDDFRYSELGTDTPLDVDDKLIIRSTSDGSGSDVYEGTFLVNDWYLKQTGPTAAEMRLYTKEYVFGCLSEGLVYYSASQTPLAGSSDALVEEILADRFPWIDTSQIETYDALVDYMVDGKLGTKVIEELANLGAVTEGPTVVYGDHDSLVFKHLDDIKPVSDEPWKVSDHFNGYLNAASGIQEFVNHVRMSGGIDNVNVDDAQTDTSGGTVQVSDTNRLITQVDNRKSELVKIELYTVGDGTSSDGLRIRLQSSNSDNTGPIAPDDTNSDLVNSGARKVALDDDGWTDFNLGEHDIPRQPWLIIDSPGEDGYGVKVAADGVTPAYKVHFPKPILAEMPDARSQQRYLRHDTEVTNEAIVTQKAARDRARAELEGKAFPDIKIGPFEARSQSAYELRTGDVVPLDTPEMRLQDDFLVTKRKIEYSDIRATVNITLENTRYDV